MSVGDAVEGQYGTDEDELWWPATVTRLRANGSVDVRYDDGDVEQQKPRSRLRLQPPVRQQQDRDALRAGLADGSIDALVSDHNPVSADAKILPFAEAEPGATAVELLLGLSAKWAQQDGLGLMQALAVLTRGPQAVLGNSLGTLQHSVGQWSVGGQADLCIFNANQSWRIEPSALRSQGKHTPFGGHEMPVSVRTTLVGGYVAYENPAPQA